MAKSKVARRKSSSSYRVSRAFARDERALERSLDNLSSVTTRIRYLGIISFIVSIANFIVMGLVIGRTIFRFYGITTIVFTSVLLGIWALAGIVMYEYLRKKGDVLFEEISDELQWYVQSDGPDIGVQGTAEKRPILRARIVLRAFAQNTDLPLVPGKFGPAVYVLVNMIVVFLLLYFIRFFAYYVD